MLHGFATGNVLIRLALFSESRQEILVTFIRKYVYAGLLALNALNFAPALVSAQEVRGRFTLSHEVRWQNAVVPVGDYRFSYESNGIGVLRLDKVSGGRAGFLFIVPDKLQAKPTDLSRLVLETTPAGSYVSALQLPDFGMTLLFNVPSAKAEKQMAKARSAALASK